MKFFATLNITIQLQKLKEKIGRKPKKEAKEEGSLYSQYFVHVVTERATIVHHARFMIVSGDDRNKKATQRRAVRRKSSILPPEHQA